MDRIEKFWEELKKRNVVRAFIFYAVSAWLIIQFATATFPYLNFPPWATTAVIVSLLVGAPIVLIVSWIYELTSEGLKKTGSVPEEKSISKNTGQRISRLSIVILSLAVVFLLVDKFYLSASSEPGTEQTKAIAVFPFSIQGSPDIQYLKEGMVDLISSKLDAMPGLNATDPNVVLSVANSKGLDNRNPVAAAAAAEDFGANRVILGSITQIGDLLEVKISKYDNAGRPVGKAIIEKGTAAELYNGVDNIIRRLVADELEEQGSEFDSKAVLTTNNLESIIPFLRGIQLSRQGKHEAALIEFRESLEADSSFVLGYYRYIINAGWVSGVSIGQRRNVEYLPYFNRLEAMSTDLKGKNGEVVRAYMAYLNSDISSEAIYRRLLNKYGESVEILSGLAESIYHHRQITAGNSSDAKPYFERLLELDPTKDEYLEHIMQITESEGDLEAFNNYAARLNPESEQQYTIPFNRMMLQDSVTQSDILELSRLMKPSFPFLPTQKVELLEGLEIAKKLQTIDEKFAVQIMDDWIQYMEPTVRGQQDWVVKENFDFFDQQGIFKVEFFISMMQSSFDGIPIWTKYADDLIPKFEASREIFKKYLPNIPPLEMDYLIGLANMYEGNFTEANKQLTVLRSSFDDETKSDFGKVRDQARLLYYNFAGILDYTQGRDVQAKQHFDSAVTQVKRVTMDYAIGMGKPRNYHLAEYKVREGKYEEALNIYLNTLESTGLSIRAMSFTWGFNVYRIAQMYDKLDRKEEAIGYYNTFVEAYQNADEMYAPWVNDAYSRLSVLVGRPEQELRGNID